MAYLYNNYNKILTYRNIMAKIKKNVLETGIDIGSSSVKFVQLSGPGDNPVLVNFDVIKADKDTDSVKKALANIAGRLSLKEVNISVSGPAVIVRYIELPKMTDEELKSSIKFEAEKHIPFNTKEVVLDCQAVEYISHSKMRVLLVAAKKDAVSSRLELITEAGLSVKVIDCDSFALVNAFLLNFPDIDEGKNTALLNLGEALTSINILKGKIPYFTRELQIGGQDFTKAISERLNLDTKAASDLKENPGKKTGELTEASSSVTARLIDEVRLSLNYYENQMGAAIDNIYLSGGLSNFARLAGVFGENLGAACDLWDPLKNLKIAAGIKKERLDAVRPQLAVAVGLALRG